jgi:hypothetical protein
MRDSLPWVDAEPPVMHVLASVAQTKRFRSSWNRHNRPRRRRVVWRATSERSPLPVHGQPSLAGLIGRFHTPEPIS